MRIDRDVLRRLRCGIASPEDLATTDREELFAAKSDTGERFLRSCTTKAPERKQGRGFTFVVSEESVDRMGDRILVNGWDLSEFKRNPAMRWAHDDRTPEYTLGTWPDVRKEAPQLLGDAEFIDAGINPTADMIFEMVDRKVIRAASVGFMPVKVKRPQDPTERDDLGLGEYGVLYEKAKLLEISIVPIPAHPKALRKSMAEACEAAQVDLHDPRLEAFLAGMPDDLAELFPRRKRKVFPVVTTATFGPSAYNIELRGAEFEDAEDDDGPEHRVRLPLRLADLDAVEELLADERSLLLSELSKAFEGIVQRIAKDLAEHVCQAIRSGHTAPVTEADRGAGAEGQGDPVTSKAQAKPDSGSPAVATSGAYWDLVEQQLEAALRARA